MLNILLFIEGFFRQDEKWGSEKTEVEISNLIGFMTKTKRNQRIHVDKVDTTIATLKELEPLPKFELTLRETIAKMEVHLRGAIKKGYSCQDLSGILAKQDILISAATLKQYLKGLDKSSKSRRRKKSASNSDNVSEANLKLVSDNSDSNNNSATAKKISQSLNQGKTNEVAGAKKKAISILNSGIKTASGNSKKELVDSPANLRKDLLEKLKDPNYQPYGLTDEDYKDDFNDFSKL